MGYALQYIGVKNGVNYVAPTIHDLKVFGCDRIYEHPFTPKQWEDMGAIEIPHWKPEHQEVERYFW